VGLKPLTLPHFREYTSRIVLDTGEYWELEDFQADIVEPILAGVPEVWGILPEGNAKTTLLAGVALYYADYSPLPWIPVGASSRDQAEILAQQAYQMVRSSPGMLQRFRIYEGYRRIKPIRPDHPAPGNRGIQVYAADVGHGDGVIPYPLAICDELHRHPDMRLYRLWKGKLNKRGGQIIGISTAGEPGSEFEELRDRIRDQAFKRERRNAHLCVEARGIVMNEWRVENPKQIANMAEVKLANPLSAITVQSLQAEFESPTVDIGNWTRLKCNIPARSTRAAVSEAEWEAALTDDQIPAGAHIDLGVDVAWKHDTFAIVPLYRAASYHLLGDCEILVPPRDGSTLHPDEVKAAFRSFLERYEVEAVIIDLPRAEDIAAWLEDEFGVTVIQWSTGNAQAALDYEAFMDRLRNGTLKHTGDPGLRAHVMHAISRTLPGDKRRFERPSSSRAKSKQDLRVIDALSAAGMVNGYAHHVAQHKLAGTIDDYRIESLG
jgi:phage terminase large subunit-like protein